MIIKLNKKQELWLKICTLVKLLWTQLSTKTRQWFDELWIEQYEFRSRTWILKEDYSCINNWKHEQDMSTTGVEENKEQYPWTLYLYPRHLFYLPCSSSHLYGSSLSLKLLSLYSKLFKGCALRPKASIKRWFGYQVAWLAFQVDLACTPSYPKAVPWGNTALRQLFRSFYNLIWYNNL
jgi:hypothetical protein